MTILHKEFTGLSETLLFEYPNIEKLSEFLSTQKRNPESVLEFKETEPDTGSRQEEVLPVQAAEKVPEPGTDRSSDIAVIGMSGMFPKAENQHDFWDNLMENKDCVSEIPEDRWDSSYYSEEKRQNTRHTVNGEVLLIVRIDLTRCFSVSPWEADLMDPQQKLYVTCCWEAMEDAGYGNPAARPTDQIGVFAGVTWNEYSLIAHEEGFLKDQYKGPGSLYWGFRTGFLISLISMDRVSLLIRRVLHRLSPSIRLVRPLCRATVKWRWPEASTSAYIRKNTCFKPIAFSVF